MMLSKHSCQNKNDVGNMRDFFRDITVHLIFHYLL